MIDIKIDGVSTSTIDGCQLVNSGENKASRLRYNERKVYGMNGFQREMEAYDEVDRTLLFHCLSFEGVTRVISFFYGQDKKIAFWYIPNSFYYYDFIDASYRPVTLASWDVEIKISLKPFRYIANVPDVVLTASGSLNNVGTVMSEPRIVLEGNGETSLTIGNQVMRLRLDTKATIECRHGFQNVFNKTGQLKNSVRLSGPFFEIPVGSHIGVTLGPGITKATISPRWRYSV